MVGLDPDDPSLQGSNSGGLLLLDLLVLQYEGDPGPVLELRFKKRLHALESGVLVCLERRRALGRIDSEHPGDEIGGLLGMSGLLDLALEERNIVTSVGAPTRLDLAEGLGGYRQLQKCDSGRPHVRSDAVVRLHVVAGIDLRCHVARRAGMCRGSFRAQAAETKIQELHYDVADGIRLQPRVLGLNITVAKFNDTHDHQTGDELAKVGFQLLFGELAVHIVEDAPVHKVHDHRGEVRGDGVVEHGGEVRKRPHDEQQADLLLDDLDGLLLGDLEFLDGDVPRISERGGQNTMSHHAVRTLAEHPADLDVSRLEADDGLGAWQDLVE